MNLTDIKLFVTPINAPLPKALEHLATLKGTFVERIAAAERVSEPHVLPLSGSEANVLAAHPEVFDLPVLLYVTYLPGAAPDPMLDAAMARLGANTTPWDAVEAAFAAERTIAQRTKSTRGWEDGIGAPSTESKTRLRTNDAPPADPDAGDD